MRLTKHGICIIFLCAVFSIRLSAKQFFVDPKTGDIENNGSYDNPWSTLEEVFKAGKIASSYKRTEKITQNLNTAEPSDTSIVQPGDTIVLREGIHGEINAQNYHNSDYITIMAASNHSPRLVRISFDNCSKWILRGVQISASFSQHYKKQTLIYLSKKSFQCIIEHCTAFSVTDISSWSKEDWNSKSCNGIEIWGQDNNVVYNTFRNVNFAITCAGNDNLVSHNNVINFSGDGIRGLGNSCIYQYNTIKNSYAVNSNHDDGFQSWSVGEDGKVGTGVVKDVVLRGNIIINYEDPNQPHKGQLQGIGCFDGMFENWIVENNVVCVDHYHGISLYGATKCVIVNNTVVDIEAQRPGDTWVMIENHKNGTASKECIVKNNLCTALNIKSHDVEKTHNIIVGKYDDFFIGFSRYDFHLKKGCAAVDAGDSANAPSIDIEGTARPNGNGCDVGAYEWCETAIQSQSQTPINPMTCLCNIVYQPTQKAIMITLRNAVKNAKVIVMTSAGKRIHTVSNIQSNHTIINTDKLSRGMYFFHIVNDLQRYSKPVVIY